MDDGYDEATVRKLAGLLVQRGLTVADIAAGDDDPFWALVADEVGVIKARQRWQVIRGARSLRLPRDRWPAWAVAAIADKPCESPSPQGDVPAGWQRQYRG
jgi:hypothetical protein